MSLNQADLKKIAHLARINVSEQETKVLEEKLQGIMSLIDQMQNVDTDNVEPMSHAIEVSQPLRDDIVKETDIRKDSLPLASEVHDSLFVVPQVIE
jgi:aspartyl-tRNA(Asn)/glutamyl-tRNA(Gln) amidotransferase subunit C